MNIITGYKNEPHVTGQQFRNQNMGVFGSGTYILDVGSKMAATVVSANTISIADGIMVGEGNTAEVGYGTSETLTIANGSQGMLRTDLIVARYTKAAGTPAVENMELVVIKGTAAASNPATPAYNTGSIADGDSPVDFPLYAVHLDGISITSVERLADIVSVKGDIDTIKGRVDDLEAHMPEHIDDTWQYTAIGIGANLAYSATKSIAKAGYTPTGIKGFRVLNDDTNGKNAGWCVMPKIWIDGNNMEFTIWNQHLSQQAVVKVQIKVEYVSNNAV